MRAMFPYGNRESDFAPRRGISLFKDHLDIGFNISWAGDFRGGPVIKTTHFQCRGQVFNPWSGNLVAWTKENKQKSKKKKSIAGLCGLADVPGPLWTSAAINI